MPTEGETLHVSVLSYRCSIRPPLASVLVVTQPTSEVPGGIKNYPVYTTYIHTHTHVHDCVRNESKLSLKYIYIHIYL